jgi:hypothetical protein
MTYYYLPPRAILPALVSTSAAILMVVGLSIVVRDEIPLLLLQPVVLVLAAGAAYVLDDPSRSLTDVVPPSLLRRRAYRVLAGCLVLAAGGAILAALLQWVAPAAPIPALAWETAGLVFLAVAVSAVTARYLESEPGNLVSSAGALIFLGVLILQPILHLTWLVSSPADPARKGWWAAIMFASALTFVLCSRGWSRRRSRRSRQPTRARIN